MSLGLAERTGRTPSTVEPNVDAPRSAPNRILPTERPIACAINRVSSVPAAPTSVPATSSSVLPST
jgi:hypothetical protein